MRKTSIALLVGALVIIASLVVGPAASAKSESASAATVVFIHEQEPPNQQGPWVGNNLAATSLVLNNIWYGGQIRNNTAAWVVRNFTAAPKLLKRNPLTVQATYKDTAVWSDGKPVTGADFIATWKVFVNPKFNVISRSGWEDIKSVKASGKGKKTFTVVFKKRYADWETLVSGGPYPAHIIKGKDMNQMFLNDIPVSSGPWKFASWQKGVQITLVKNTAYKAGPPLKIGKLVFRYILDTNARFQAMKAGEGQVMEPQPQLQIADFKKDKRFVVDTKVGYTYEHLDIQLGPQGHPALRQPYVRQALISGINRQQIANVLYSSYAPNLPALQSIMYMPFEPWYKQNFAIWKFNQQKVIAILTKHGCTGGPSKPSASNSSIFSCPNVGKLSFRFGTTTGNTTRALAFEIMQRQLKSVGIELTPRFQVAGTLFGTTLPSRDWDILMFAWVSSPTGPITNNIQYGCGGDQNYMTYCNKKASKLMDAVVTELNVSKGQQLNNEAEAKYIAKDIPTIPMLARPLFVIHAKSLKGPVVNPTSEGTPWNVSTWTTSSS